MVTTIENEFLRVSVSDHGAELMSVYDKASGRELLWQGDKAWWGRRAPVLFPIVGRVWQNTYRVDGVEYHLSQHGIARDMDFTLTACEPDYLEYTLKSNAETLKVYPWEWTLVLSYTLEGQSVRVDWEVTNDSSSEMHFQLGFHPAFNTPAPENPSDPCAYIEFYEPCSEWAVRPIGEGGCVKAEKEIYEIPDGIIDIKPGIFAGDALIFEDEPMSRVVLEDASGEPILYFEHEQPVLAFWSPAKEGHAPFVCIEPWHGRTDLEGYTGEFADKDFMEHLAPGESTGARYTFGIL